MKEEYKEIYKTLSSDDRKIFRKAIEEGNENILLKYVNPKKKAGRPNLGLTDMHRLEYNRERREMRKAPQPDTFTIEKVKGEIIEDDNIEQFKELYRLTCFSILEEFKQENEELCKKHPYNWYKKVLIRIKQSTPRVDKEELPKLEAIWDVLSEFMAYIGLYITYETFQNMAGFYDYQLVKLGELNPKYAEFREKIFIERDNALVDELQHNPYNQTNKIFIAKCHGIIEKTEQRTIEVVHTAKKLDDIPIFTIEDQNQKE